MPAGSGRPAQGWVSPSTPSAASAGRSRASTKASVISADAVPSASTPRTAGRLKSRGRGRVRASSVAAATDSRSQADPAGESAANRWVLSAAPSWTDSMAARATRGAGTGPVNVRATSASIGRLCAYCSRIVDMEKLRALVELDRLGTMTEVARVTGYGTSAVSQQLAALERQGGARLVEAEGRRGPLPPA